MVLSIPGGTSPCIVCAEDIDGELFECQYLGPEKAARFKSTDGQACGFTRVAQIPLGNECIFYSGATGNPATDDSEQCQKYSDLIINNSAGDEKIFYSQYQVSGVKNKNIYIQNTRGPYLRKLLHH